MPQAHKNSFLIILGLIFLLPIFFIPGGALYLDSAKSALLILGVIAGVLTFVYEVWKAKAVGLPKHYFLVVAALLPVVYALSAILSTPSSLSLFGYSFEVGTFGSMLLGAGLLVLVGTVFSDTSRILQALAAVFASFSLVAVVVAIKIIVAMLGGGDVLVLGHFFGNMGNPLGSWTDIAIAFGALSIFSALTLGMIPLKLSVRVLPYVVFVVSTLLLAMINFPTALIFTLIASVLLTLYFMKVEKHFHFSKGDPAFAQGSGVAKGRFTRPTILPIALGVISLVLLANPTVTPSGTKLGELIARVSKVENTEVRPSFSATLGISKAVLSQAGLLGSGPNTFGHDWLIYKPVDVNSTPFWAVAFPFGAGFVPTQIASTGILGSALWLAFFVILITLLLKAVSNMPESRAERFTVVSSLFLTVFLWAASFLFAPSVAMLMLAFAFSGLLVASMAEAGLIQIRKFDLRESSQNHFIGAVTLLLIVAGALGLGWVGFEKTASAYHFKKAVDLSNVEGALITDVENRLIKAIRFAPADIHYVALSRLNFSRAQSAASSATGTPEQNKAIFEESLSRAIESARAAVNNNPAGYQNWVQLGNIYTALVPKPLEVAGSYEQAKYAYTQAINRNPTNPELPLLLARLELSKGDAEAARSYIRNSIALKEDYADAYLMLAQLEAQSGNVKEAITSAEVLVKLAPNNPGVFFELGILKHTSADYDGAEKSLSDALKLSP